MIANRSIRHGVAKDSKPLARGGKEHLIVHLHTIPLFLLQAAVALGAVSQTSAANPAAKPVPAIESPGALDLHHVTAEPVSYRGHSAIRVSDADPDGGDNVSRIAILKGTSFQDGSIEVSLTGDTAPNAAPYLRGFVGIAFRVANQGAQYECFYLRPKNGRSDDQLQRNHSAQYISVPDSPWDKLRAESPGKYESYVDLIPGAWTKVRIQVEGRTAKLYVNGAEQPTLVVHDMKEPAQAGAIALWVGPGTIAHFANLKVSR
jgi:hypothetical protein